MADRMQRWKRAVARHWARPSRADGARTLRAANLKLMVEGLEERVVLATDTWLPGGGGIWELASNWSTGKVPSATDDVVISLPAAGTIQFTRAGDVANSITTNSNSALQLNIGGTFALGAGSSTIDAALTIVPGASMSIAPKATLAVNDADVAVQGSLTLLSGDTVTMTGSQMMPGVFDVTGIMNSTNANISGGSYTGVDVEQGGELIATNNTFATAGVFFAPGAILPPTDVTGNIFTGTVLSMPPTDVPEVTNNKQFGEVDLYGQSLTSGTSLTLPAMGTVSASTLFFRFVTSYEITAGATLNVDPKVTVDFSVPTSSGVIGTSLFVDTNGLVNFGSGDKVGLFTMPNSTTTPIGSIFINGVVSATNTSFANLDYGSGSGFTHIVVNQNGHLISSGGSFGVSQVYLDDRATLNAGDLTGNSFVGTVLSLLATDVPLVTNNLSFGEVDLHGGTLASPTTLELTAMGTASNANLFYVFVGNYTVSAGATLTVDPNLRVYDYSLQTINMKTVNIGYTLTDNGTVTFGKGDLFTLYSTPTDTTTSPPTVYPTGQIVVNGVLGATGTNFLNLPGSAFTQIVVNKGAHLSGTNDDFAASLLSLADGSILNPDKTQTTNVAAALTGDDFANTVLRLPATDIPLVTNNLQFAEVDLLPGTLASPATLELTAMGTVLTSTLFYVFTGNYTIAAGATLTVDPKLAVYDSNSAQIIDNGTFNLNTGDSLTFEFPTGAASGQVVVGGTFHAPGTVFTNQSFGGASAPSINVNSGGSFTEVGDRFLGVNVVLGPNATAGLTISSFLGSTLSVDSTDKFAITGNNFSQVGGNGVIATGSPTASIDLGGNYWGSTDNAAIRQLILDHAKDATRPTVTLSSVVANTSSIAAANATTVYSSATQNVTLNASVIGVSGTISEGTVTFGVYNGQALLGTMQTVAEANGMATVTYALPAGLKVGTYAIQAIYRDGTSTNYLPAIDTAHILSITPAPTTVVAPSTGVSVPYSNVASQSAQVSATVTSGAGVVNEGTVTYTLFTSAATPVQIGTPVTVNVVNGAAPGAFNVAVGTPGGTYVVDAVFNGSQDYASSPLATFALTVTPAVSTTSVAAATASFSTAAQTVALAAKVASVGGAVDEGAVTFTLLSGTTVIGTAVTANVAAGAAAATYSLPAGLAAGSYTIRAVFNGTADFATSSSTSQTLTIGKAASTTTSTSTTAAYDTAAHAIALTANVASGATAVNEGTVAFSILKGSTVIGTITSGPVAGGVATASYLLPGGLAVGTTYTIQANFQGSGDYLASAGSAGVLTIVKAVPVVAAATDPGVYDPQAESLTAHASVLNLGTGVDDGTVTFQVFSGTTAVGAPVTVGLANGLATAVLMLPGGTMVGTTDTVLATYSGTSNYAAGSAGAAITLDRATPVVAWAAPADLVFGQALTAAQLDATASVPGTFVYTPAAGTILGAGTGQALAATFMPTDANDYTSAPATTRINVAPAVPSFGGVSASQAIPYGQSALTLVGRLLAPTAIPVGSPVLVVVDSGTAAVSAVATVAGDGTFAAQLAVGTLPVGTYAVRYGFNGNANFFGAFDGSTTLVVTRAVQTLVAFDAPASAVYGTTFHVNLASSAGLPVTLTATNATVTPVASGGYDVTLLSGSADAVLTASQAGSANQTPLSVSRTVLAVKAQAAIVVSGISGIFYDGQPHPVGYYSIPAGLNATVTYTLDGAAVAAPVAPGTYLATATINDPNYQGAASSTVAIVAVPVTGTTPTTTTPATPVVIGPVSLVSLQATTNKHKAVTAITLSFNGDLNAASAMNLANYRLATAGKGGSYDAKNARTIRVKSASYNAATHSVTLTIARPFAITSPVQVRIYGGASRGLVDGLGRLIDGRHQGGFGGDENAILSKKGASI